ncbi:MAG: hypothetical protein WAM73_10705 [Desulfobacterales bacterium]
MSAAAGLASFFASFSAFSLFAACCAPAAESGRPACTGWLNTVLMTTASKTFFAVLNLFIVFSRWKCWLKWANRRLPARWPGR